MNMYPRVLISRYLLCRKGSGDEVVFDIRRACYDEQGLVVYYETEPLSMRASSVEELRVLLEEATNALSGEVLRVADHVEVEYDLR